MLDQPLNDIFTGWAAMTEHNSDLVADRFGMPRAELDELVHGSVAHLAQTHYYHYLARPKPQFDDDSDENTAAQSKPRHVVLFRTPDDALSFAQRIRIGETPRVRQISRENMIWHMLNDEAIVRVIFFEQPLEELPTGLNLQTLADLPGAIAIERNDVLTSRQI
ncbi:MAG TPA: hypothetical protein DEF47_15000 [Herpetosiphon sp.]|uniref:Uncharacterized protein n=2 Tax=Herpetosiphon TaxID=64 RepID=A9B112_HERA2|nr:hypothetical protein Haur_2652 [Herpetosiphon aurantiacus DSM 785]HBW51201.1 hypothetical protein [Herpetosiphon sp.]